MPDRIKQARDAWLKEHPVDSAGLYDSSISQIGSIRPEVAALADIGKKFGVEFVTRACAEEELEEWVDSLMGVTNNLLSLPFLFAGVLSGIRGALRALEKHNPGILAAFEGTALELWKEEI